MDRKKALANIAKEIASCTECKTGKSGLPVPGEGRADARIMLVGMAPGREEARIGRPFVGRSGKFLDRMLASIGIPREDVFITSPVKYFPRKKALTKKDIEHGRVHLLAQMEAIAPHIVVLLGDAAAKALLPEKRISVMATHGQAIRKNRRTYFITFHPSAAMRFPAIKKLMEADFRSLKKLLRRFSLP